jgi:hypothetical protein
VKLGRPNVSAKVEDAIRKRLAAGDGILKTAKALGVVQRVKTGLFASVEQVAR